MSGRPALGAAAMGLALLAGWTAAAGAQTLDAMTAAVLGRVIDWACLDVVDGSIGCEVVVLMRNPDRGTADLVVLPDWRNETRTPLAVASDLVFDGPMWGQSAQIGQRESGALTITSQQTAVGRSAWEQTLTLVWRDGGFVVAGLTHASWDRLTARAMRCDVNLLSGRWERLLYDPSREEADMRETGRMARPDRLRLSDWHADTPLPQPCADGLAALWQED